jgi:hypothetical protein
MSISLSGVFPESSAMPSTVPTPSAVAPAIENPDEDTVTLSQAAQVDHLNVQGATPAQIAANLGISLSTVDIDLGIAATTDTVPVVAAHPAAASAAPASTAKTPAGAAPASAPQVLASPARKSAAV